MRAPGCNASKTGWFWPRFPKGIFGGSPTNMAQLIAEADAEHGAQGVAFSVQCGSRLSIVI